MAKISIPFNKWSRNKLKLQLKTATTMTKLYGRDGDFFKVGFQDYRLEAVFRTSLEIVAKNFWKEEGAESEEDFKDQWKQIHPNNGFIPSQMVWLHFFTEYNPRRL